MRPGILAHFDTRLNRLERTILPLHQSTQATTRLQSCASSPPLPYLHLSSPPSLPLTTSPLHSHEPDIDKTLASLSSVRSHRAASQTSSVRLLSPPSSLSSDTADLASFTAALDKVLEHIGDVRRAGLAGAEEGLRESERLAEGAFRALCRLLSSTLREGSPGTPPPLVAYPLGPALEPGASLTTFDVVCSSGIVGYLCACPLSAAGAGKREWDDVWRVWSAVRGEWLRSGVSLNHPTLASSIGGGGEEPTEGQLVHGWLLAASTERTLLSTLFPPSHPLPSSILQTALVPSLTALKQHVGAHVQTLKKDPLPWRLYALFGELTDLGARWAEFFAGSGGVAGEWLAGFDTSPAGAAGQQQQHQQGELAKALRAACTRAIPEAVESAKVSAVLRPGEAPSVAVSSTTTEVRAPLFLS